MYLVIKLKIFFLLDRRKVEVISVVGYIWVQVLTIHLDVNTLKHTLNQIIPPMQLLFMVISIIFYW